jgi:iron complex transport system permease protein
VEAVIADPTTAAHSGEKIGSRHIGIVLVTLLGILLAVILCSIAMGAVRVPIQAMLGAVLNQQHLSREQPVILFQIRLPRILAATLVGAALSTAGLLFQGLFRNPLADPYVIGSSGGAILGACVGMFVLPQLSVFGFSATALLAFAGSLLTIMLVYRLARVGGRTSVVTLLLAGFAVSTMLSYSSYFLEVLDEDYGTGMRVLASWLRGVIGVPRWGQLAVIAAMFLIAFAFCLPIARRLNTLALGDEYAQQLGLNVEHVHISIIVVGSLLTAAAVGLGGLISFVGLIVPHLARMVMGPDHFRMLPVTAISGAIFLVVTDTLARTILAPSEMPVGVLMACIGGPFFLYLLRRTRREYAL